MSFALIPACFALVWLVLPLRDCPWARSGSGSRSALAALASASSWAASTPENFCKLFGVTAFGFWFLRYFETL